MISCLQVYLIENENTRGIQKKEFLLKGRGNSGISGL
jgi:hypothetical protein